MWQKGQSGNPKGRPKRGHALTDALKEKIDKDQLPQVLIKMATEEGNFQAARYIYDRLEGMPTQKQELEHLTIDEDGEETGIKFV